MLSGTVSIDTLNKLYFAKYYFECHFFIVMLGAVKLDVALLVGMSSVVKLSVVASPTGHPILQFST